MARPPLSTRVSSDIRDYAMNKWPGLAASTTHAPVWMAQSLRLYSVGLETWHGCSLALKLCAYQKSGRSDIRDARCALVKFARAKREVKPFLSFL